MLVEQPSREGIQSLLTPIFDSTVVHPAPMVFCSISIWRIVGIRGDQEVIVDLLLADSEYLRTALARRGLIQFGLLQVPILTIEDVILLKTMAGRLQDQADLEKILLRQNELHVDWGYVESWKTKLGLGE
jgi:predicted nucleotidyltransferase